MTTKAWDWWKVVRIAFGLVALAFMAATFVATYRRTEDLPLPSPLAVALGFVFVLVGLWCAARSWTALLPAGDRGILTRGFFAAQLAKYVPGGIWQPVSQVASARRSGLSLAASSVGFPVHVVVQLIAGLTMGASLGLLAPEAPTALKTLSTFALLSLVALHRRWMVATVRAGSRLARRTSRADVVPDQASILRSFAWTLGTFGASGTGLAMIAASNGGADPAAAAIPAFGLAWAAGFLALPVPAGLGVRELVLVLAAGAGVNPSHVIAASLAHRLVTIAGEAISYLVASVRGRAAQPLQAPPDSSYTTISEPGRSNDSG